MWPATYTVAVTAPNDRLHGGPLRIGPRAVLVPVKAFSQAKRRLHLALSEPERAELARAMADRVVSAAHPLPVVVVCDDNEVAEWARARRALVVWEPGRGLDGAVEASSRLPHHEGAPRACPLGHLVVVAHHHNRQGVGGTDHPVGHGPGQFGAFWFAQGEVEATLGLTEGFDGDEDRPRPDPERAPVQSVVGRCHRDSVGGRPHGAPRAWGALGCDCVLRRRK